MIDIVRAVLALLPHKETLIKEGFFGGELEENCRVIPDVNLRVAPHLQP